MPVSYTKLVICSYVFLSVFLDIKFSMPCNYITELTSLLFAMYLAIYLASLETPAKWDELLLYCHRIFKRYSPGIFVTPRLWEFGSNPGIEMIEKSLSYPVAQMIFETSLPPEAPCVAFRIGI